MTVMAPCANRSCRLPVAVDGVPAAPAGILCVEHLLLLGLDLRAVDRGPLRCQHAAASCEVAPTSQTLIGAFCAAHAPRKLVLSERTVDEKKEAESKAITKAMRTKESRMNRRAMFESEGGIDE